MTILPPAARSPSAPACVFLQLHIAKLETQLGLPLSVDVDVNAAAVVGAVVAGSMCSGGWWG